jgi:hypothetical protein
MRGLQAPVGWGFLPSKLGASSLSVGAYGRRPTRSFIIGAHPYSSFFVSRSEFPAGGYGMVDIQEVSCHLILVMACMWYGYDDIVLVALS